MSAGNGVAGLDPRDETPGGEGLVGSSGPVPQPRPPMVLLNVAEQRNALMELGELLDTVAVHLRVCDAGELAGKAELWSERIKNFLQQHGADAVGAPSE